MNSLIVVSRARGEQKRNLEAGSEACLELGGHWVTSSQAEEGKVKRIGK